MCGSPNSLQAISPELKCCISSASDPRLIMRVLLWSERTEWPGDLTSGNLNWDDLERAAATWSDLVAWSHR